MDAEQRAAAFGVLGTGLSERGTALARGVIELEGTLRDLEGGLSSLVGPRRDPGLYFLALFAGPGHRRDTVLPGQVGASIARHLALRRVAAARIEIVAVFRKAALLP